ncbi:hypothetical protein GJ744_003289 [Endocarpon pusillum]|uniref:Uncharacterized protein n=1 Tax=Endocarpon pusillum TaxID=364733 RepID=A0A8H7AAX4_9EURO|nr:hypothetical protein GJ744_003289 [Endocarpon pusillum]
MVSSCVFNVLSSLFRRPSTVGTDDLETSVIDLDSLPGTATAIGVSACSILGEDDDLGFGLGWRKLQDLFQKDFIFNARVYEIPSDNLAVMLYLELASFFVQHSLER